MLFGTEILHKIHKTTLISTILNFGPLNIITICLYSDKHGSINNPSLSPLCSCFKGSAVCHSWPIHTSSQCHFSPICPPTRTFSFIRIWRCCVHPHCPILRVSSHPYLILCDSSTSQPWSDVLRISMSKMWTKKMRSIIWYWCTVWYCKRKQSPCPRADQPMKSCNTGAAKLKVHQHLGTL